MLTLVIFTFADVTSSNAMMAHKLTEYFHFNIRNKKISLSSKAKVKYFSKKPENTKSHKSISLYILHKKPNKE